MIPGRIVNILGADSDVFLLGPGDLLLVPVDIVGRLHHRLGDVRIGVTAQGGKILYPVIMHGINKMIPGNVRIFFSIVGRLKNAHGPVKDCHVSVPVIPKFLKGRSIPLGFQGKFHISKTAENIGAGLGILQFFVPVQIGGACSEVLADLLGKHIGP